MLALIVAALQGLASLPGLITALENLAKSLAEANTSTAINKVQQTDLPAANTQADFVNTAKEMQNIQAGQ